MAQTKPDSMFKAMLAQVKRIPRGKVATYGDIAYAAGYPGAARQVAWALHQDSAGLPWHRVLGADGKILLGGEMGFEQRMRLQAEGITFRGLRVAMDLHHYSFFADRKTTRGTRGSKREEKSRQKPRRT